MMERARELVHWPILGQGETKALYQEMFEETLVVGTYAHKRVKNARNLAY